MNDERLEIEPFIEKCEDEEQDAVKIIIQDIFNTIKKEHGVE